MKKIKVINTDSSNRFESECNKLVKLGYVLKSSNCYAYGYDGQVDEWWQAIFVLPDEKIVRGFPPYEGDLQWDT